MKLSGVMVVLFTSSVVGAGCQRAPSGITAQHSTTDDPVAQSSSDAFPGYSILFQRAAQPQWKPVTFDHFSLSIPYSSEWKFSDVGLSLYDSESPLEDMRIIRFGKPIDAGTFATREYYVYRESRENKEGRNSLDHLKLRLSCVDGFASRIIVLGDIQGVEHHNGGAKGCSTGFVFNKGDYSYYIYRIPDIKGDAPEINDEMKRIIQSIHD